MVKCSAQIQILSLHPVMKSAPRISDTEWEVMRVIWAGHPVTAAEVIRRLSALDPAWHPKTVRTLLARLVEKGALDYRAHGRTYEYHPAVSEEACVADASGSFVERVFGGALKPMLVHFIEQRRLTRADLDELRGLLDEQPKEEKPKPARKEKKSS